jgi:hypothetical protein
LKELQNNSISLQLETKNLKLKENEAKIIKVYSSSSFLRTFGVLGSKTTK